MKVVLDTNVLISGFFFGGVPGRILRAWQEDRIAIVLSASILAEYREVASRLESRYGGSDFETFTALLVMHSEIVDAPERLDEVICSDPHDDKFLVCASVAGAPVVVSGDAHLLEMDGWRAIQVIKPRPFLDRYLSS